MIRAKRTDKQLIIRLLTNAFIDNLSVNYIIRQDDKSRERISALMDYSFEVCYRFGQVWLTEDHKACALVTYPHQKKNPFVSAWLDGLLIIRSIGIGGIFKTLKRESRVKAKQPKEPMAYLWFIGVSPIYQRQGIGGKLLKEVLRYETGQKLPVYLETSTERNLPWYGRHGFRIYDAVEVDYYSLHFLKYESAK